jgi:Skp family chaperone for outer membrane proteins
MQRPKQLFVIALALMALLANTWAQSADPALANTHSAAPSQPAASAADIQALKEGLAAAQQQIQALQEQLQRRDQDVQQAQSTASAAAAKADAAQIQATKQEQTVGELQSDLADLKSASFSSSKDAEPVYRNAVLNLQDPATAHSAPETEVYNKQMESPITIRFRGINITPGGYAAAEFVRRTRALGADVSTPFNSLTMPGASQSQLSEFFGSGRQSKTTVFVDGRLGNVDLSSYVSADFLSAGVTSTSTSTNSYTLRLRQAWAQAKFHNGWSFLGGQTWSLITEDAKGIAPDDDLGKTNDVRPKTVDSSYNVGFNYARQYGIRLTKTLGDKVAVAVALENAQATLSTHGNASNYLLGESGASNSYNTGATYSFNPSPDIIAKIAFDPGFGHYEVLGLLSRFTDRVFPCVEFASGNPQCTGQPAAAGAYNASKEGGGLGASARWTFAKHVVFGLKGTGGSGIGRYAPGGLSDASINADGTLHLIKNFQGLGTLEWHGKKLDLYSYGGVEYASRTFGLDSITGKNVGYGAPTFNNTGCYAEVSPGSGGFSPGSLANCTGDTRALIEGTIGFWYRFYRGPMGRFQYGTQYSYVSRNTWSGNGGLPTGSAGLQPGGLDSMVFSSFRYYLP